MMNIHLSKPGGQREGPFTLEQINQDLATRKYHDSDYWAWYEGLNEWVPLHQVPGVIRSTASEPQEIPGPDTTHAGAGDTEVIYRGASTSQEEPLEQTPTEEYDLSNVTSSPEEAAPQEQAAATEDMASPAESVIDGESSFERETVGEGTIAPEGETGPHETPISEEETMPPEEGSSPEEAALESEGAEQEEQTVEEEPGQKEAETPQQTTPEEETTSQEFPVQTEEPAQPAGLPPSLANQLFSGMPFEALEQVILLCSGDAQNASRSAITTGMLEAAIGSELDAIREKIPRDAMGGCAFLEKLREGGRIPDAALRAAAKLKPDLVRQAREGLYRISVRTFPIETGEMVALFLFYNKQML